MLVPPASSVLVIDRTGIATVSVSVDEMGLPLDGVTVAVLPTSSRWWRPADRTGDRVGDRAARKQVDRVVDVARAVGAWRHALVEDNVVVYVPPAKLGGIRSPIVAPITHARPRIADDDRVGQRLAGRDGAGWARARRSW